MTQKKNNNNKHYLHSYSFQKLKQRLWPVFCVLFAFIKSVALVDQRLDFFKFECTYSITAFDHSFPDPAGVHGGNKYYVSFL